MGKEGNIDSMFGGNKRSNDASEEGEMTRKGLRET